MRESRHSPGQHRKGKFKLPHVKKGTASVPLPVTKQSKNVFARLLGKKK